MWRVPRFLIAVVLVGSSLLAADKAPPAHVIIHRQALQAAPQNRWAALKQAVRWGADQTITLEVDLHATKDGRIILFHDPWFDGQNDEVLGPTTDWLWEEINDLDFGSWYDQRFKDERLVLFEDALEFCKWNNVRLTLDIQETVPPEMVREVLKKHDAATVVYWSWRGGFGKLVGTPIKIMSFDGDREMVRRAAERAPGNTVWVDDPRVLLDVLHRHVPKRDVKMPKMRLDYHVEDLDPNDLQRQVRSGGDQGRMAATRLRKHFERSAVETFMVILEDARENSQMKTSAARTLGRMAETLRGSEVETVAVALSAQLRDSDPVLRAAAAYALGKLKHQPSIRRLTERLRDREETAKVRVAAARALGRIGSQRSIRILVETARDERERAARETLPRFQELAKKKGTYWGVPRVLQACYWALGQTGGPEARDFLLAEYHAQRLSAKDALIETVMVRDKALDAYGAASDGGGQRPVYARRGLRSHTG